MSSQQEFVVENGVLKKYNGPGGEVVIPKEVKKIGEKVFCENTAVRSVRFPKGLAQIGKSAFQKCTALEEALLPDGLTAMGYGAFSGCMLLKEMEIPEGVTVLSQNVFSGCESLGRLELPHSLREIQAGACKGCSSLTDIFIPDGVDTLGRNAFSECRGLKRVTLPENIHSLNYGVFGYVDLEELTVLGALDSIDNYACAEAKVLVLPRTDISIVPTDLKRAAVIGFSRWLSSGKQVDPKIQKAYLTYLRGQRRRFYEEALVELPLLQVMIQEKMIPETEIDRMLERAGRNGLVEASAQLLEYRRTAFPQKKPLGELSLQSAVDVNGAVPVNAFKKDWRSKRVAGGLCILEYLGSNSLVEVPGIVGETPVVAIGENAFASRQDILQVILPDSIRRIEKSAFRECSAMVKINLPDNLREIGEFAFQKCSQLSEVNLPANLETLGNCSFDGCACLKQVALPEGIIKLDGGQFRNCSQLERIEFSAKIQRLDGTAFCGCFQLQKWDVDLNNPYLRVEGPFLMTADGKELLCTLPRVSGAVVMPSGLEVIGPYAFQCCTRLTSVTLPSGVRSVANSAYVECSQLSEVIFPDSLTEIGAGAFQHCFALKQVVLPQGLKQIGYQSFENTTKLLRTKPLSDSDTTSAAHLRPSNSKDFVIQNGELKRYIGTDNQVVVPAGVSVIASGAFGEQFLDHPAASVTDVVLPEGVERIESRAFAGCKNLRNVTLPNSLRQIESMAFQDCTNLPELTLPADLGCPVQWHWFSQGGISDGAFTGCMNLKQFHIQPGNLYFTYKNFALLREEGTVLVCAPGAEGDYTVPDGVKELGPFALRDNQALTSVTLPNTVRKVGPNVFNGCVSLKEVVLPDSLEEIGDHCFENCQNLRELTIPQEVQHMGDYLFEGCKHLKRVVLRCSEVKFSPHTFHSFWKKNQLFQAEIILDGCSPAKLPEDLRDRIMRRFAAQYVKEAEILPAHKDSVIQYIKRQRSKLIPLALKTPDLLEVMLREKLLKPAEKDSVRKQAAKARKQAALELLDMYEEW